MLDVCAKWAEDATNPPAAMPLERVELYHAMRNIYVLPLRPSGLSDVARMQQKAQYAHLFTDECSP